jgi:hypothetical protein
MELKELQIERRKIIQKFKDEKEALRTELKSKLSEIDKKIKGKQTSFSNKQAKTVKQVMGEVKKGGRIKADTYKWHKVQKIKKKAENK